AYDLLTVDAKAELTAEKALLDSLLVEIEIQEATLAVEIAESSHLQTDFNTAQALVTALPSSTEKIDLQDRLDALQGIIDAEAASSVDDLITAIPASGAIILSNQAQIEAARTAYDALTTAQQLFVLYEAVLTSAENELAALQVATAAVVIAEGSNLQTDLDAAQALVTALPNGTAKTDLQNRLNAVQDIIDVGLAQTIIINYFAANDVIVSRLNSNTIKATAFTAKANEIVSSLGVTVSITNTITVTRNDATYTISIVKNAATISMNIDVTFIR
ncbi:MAG: hypothetical protein KKH01_03645, partial [Firmicutes bacterium]|nr:hypothetical protein [Bacillota bacterium]